MSIEELLARFAELRLMRDKIAAGFEKDCTALREAAFSWFFAWLQDNPEAAGDEIVQEFADFFHLTKIEKARLSENVLAGQLRVAEAKARIYSELGVNAQVDTAKLATGFRVDFPRIEREVRDQVIRKIERMSVEGSDIRQIEKELRESEIVSYQARTLSNTALAQMDNAHTHAIAEQAGIDRFLYSGPGSQRLFCSAHLGKIYTTSEIADMSNGQGLSVETSCGGYNCRHEWIAVPPDVEVAQP